LEQKAMIAIEVVPRSLDLVPVTLDEPAAAPVAAAPVTAAPASRSTKRVESSTKAAITTSAQPGPEVPGPPTTNALAMRGMRHDLALSREGAERIAAAATGGGTEREQPGEPRWAHDPKIKLLDDGGGRKVVRDPVATFDVAPDGTVDIEDKGDFSFTPNLPTPDMLMKQWRWFKKDFNRWVADPYRDTRVGRSQDLPNHLLAVPGACDVYGGFGCFTEADQRKQWEMEDDGVQAGDSLGGGRADITGYLHRKFVGDPYSSRKLKILDQTRDERVRIGGEFRAEQLDRSAELVRRNLEALWRSTPDPAQRREALFTIWDECDEGEDERGAAGERARAMVIGWIRAKLPLGSAGAYSSDDIAKLDAARSSRQHFTPY
jgi:hypothetical protein